MNEKKKSLDFQTCKKPFEVVFFSEIGDPFVNIETKHFLSIRLWICYVMDGNCYRTHDQRTTDVPARKLQATLWKIPTQSCVFVLHYHSEIQCKYVRIVRLEFEIQSLIDSSLSVIVVFQTKPGIKQFANGCTYRYLSRDKHSSSKTCDID